jgi:RNA polymerase sigma-70 factor (ECF subfamily)
METMVQKPQGSLNELEAKDAHNLLIKYMLKALNPEQRACLLLREIEGLSYKEISRVLRLNIGTVRSRLKRAREALINLRNEEVIKNEL